MVSFYKFKGKVYKDYNSISNKKMKITYDKDADAMYIYLDEKSQVDRTEEVSKDVVLDYDKTGNIIGVEFLFVREKRPEVLNQIKVENLIAA